MNMEKRNDIFYSFGHSYCIESVVAVFSAAINQSHNHIQALKVHLKMQRYDQMEKQI